LASVPRLPTLALLSGALGLSACATPPKAPTPSAALAGAARVVALARTCARAASCAHPHDPPRFRDPAACVEDALEHEGELDTESRCLAAADSCGAVAVCLHRAGDVRAAAFCAAHPGVKTDCDGDTLVACAKDDPRESTLTPCAPTGAVCGESHGAGGLVAHGCLTPSACPPNVTRVQCDGTTAVAACHDEILERVACKPGTTCHAHKDEDGEEAATCEGPNEVPCGAVGQRACRGSSLVECAAHGHHAREVSVDCGALGLVCAAAGGKPACVTAGSTCAAGAPRCEHGALVFCAAGSSERVACGDLGLGPCNPEGNGLCASGSPGSPAR
jgi:hypothetical protein